MKYLIKRRSVNSTQESPIPEHLQFLYESITKDVGEKQEESIADLLISYQDVFSKGPGDLGRAADVKHNIVTGNATPIKQALRRIPVSKREEIVDVISGMEMQGIIEPSSSPWSSPVVLVRKKDGSNRFCGLDLKSGYWQVELEQGAKEKTAFSTGKSLWQFKVMPFGLCNALATFERLMEAVLAKLPWQTSLVYLDDIIVHSIDFDSHVKNLSLVMERLCQANLKFNPKKCKLFRNQVQFLGYTVSKDGISADKEK